MLSVEKTQLAEQDALKTCNGLSLVGSENKHFMDQIEINIPEHLIALEETSPAGGLASKRVKKIKIQHLNGSYATDFDIVISARSKYAEVTLILTNGSKVKFTTENPFVLNVANEGLLSFELVKEESLVIYQISVNGEDFISNKEKINRIDVYLRPLDNGLVYKVID